MGLRGPGAKAKGKVKAAPARTRAAAWERKGLSRADRAISFIQTLRLTAGRHAGKPFRLREWQRDIIRKIYRTKGKHRAVRTALVTMARKNGKTALASALAMTHLLGPEAEPRGEVYSAASDRNQAARVFRELEAMVLADPALTARVNIQRFNKKIEVLSGPGAGSTYEALSSDARKAHSLSPSFVVCDELAQWPSRELYDALMTGGGARSEPLAVIISTMSSDPHHVLNELVTYGKSVEAGDIKDPSFASFIFTTDPAADPWDESLWYAANPALADFRSLEEMRIFAEQAQRVPAKESVFRNLYLNQPVNADTRFINAADWAACAGEVNPEALRGKRCTAGLDLGSTTDLTALVLYFFEDGGQVLPFFWVPADRLDEREHHDHVPYRQWHRAGLLEAPAGRAINKLSIIQRIAQIAAEFDIGGIAYDRWRLEDLEKLLTDEGIELTLIPWGQGYKSMGPATDALEAAILDRKLIQPEHPILTWNVSNAVVETDPTGARKISKRKSTERVDGLVALTMAVGLAAVAEVEEGSVYDHFEPIWLEGDDDKG